MRKIYMIHQWVSLVCALFLLLLTLTGLPLLFRGEINAWNTVNMPQRGESMPLRAIWQALPAGTAAVTAAFPEKEILGVTPDGSDGTLYFLVKDRSGKAGRSHMRMGGEQIMYDARVRSLTAGSASTAPRRCRSSCIRCTSSMSAWGWRRAGVTSSP